MGVIKYASKWNRQFKKWETPEHNEKFRSFAVGSYLSEFDTILNSSEPEYNYVIISYGFRVEDHSNDTYKINKYEFFIDRFVDYFMNNSKSNYIVRYVMLDADAPLVEEAKKLASYIDNLASIPGTKSINIVGLSKCGAINMYAPKYLKNSKSYELTHIYNIATPYSGTTMASPLYFYPKIKELVTSKFGDNAISNFIYKKLVDFYESRSSNSHMDYDIAKLGGVSEDKKDNYDEEFIKNIFSDENIEALKKINGFENFTTHIDKDVIKKAIQTGDFNTIGLCILNSWFFDKKSDGFVLTSDQSLVENYLEVKSKELASSHMIMTSDSLDTVLESINENVEEKKERTRC